VKVIAAGLALLIVLAFGAYKQEQSPVVITCGSVGGGTTMVATGANWAGKFGGWVHNVAENPDQYRDPANVKTTVDGVAGVLWYWLRAPYLALRGDGPDPEVEALKAKADADRAAAEAQCTPCPQALPQTSNSLASLTAAPVTGSPEETTRQVAARYWPADQVPTAVAIAGAESTWNDDPPGAPKGMLGRWQINGPAHPDLVAGKNWRDPSVNAAMAYQIWKDRGSWSDWSTYTSGRYKKFLSPVAASTAAVTTTDPKTGSPIPGGELGGLAPQIGKGLGKLAQKKPKTLPVPVPAPVPAAPVNPQNVGCNSAGMPSLRIATWNTYCGVNRDSGIGCGSGRLAERVARVLGGMQDIAKQADIINTQEMSSGELRTRVLNGLDGFSMAGANTSHPIFVRNSACGITSDKSDLVFTRGTPMEGPDQGDRWVNTAVLDCGGKTVTDINFHQLPKIQKDGKLNEAWPKRAEAASEIFAAAMTSARVHIAKGAVIEACDCNFDGPIPGAAAAGLTSASSIFGDLKQATRTRDIDQIMFSAGRPSSEKVLPAHGSDHSPRIVTFLSSAPDSPVAAVAGMRSVTDPTSHKTYQVQIPSGPRGVAINYAIEQLGKRYVWGAHGPNTFDCSGLMSAAWAKAGVTFTPQTEAMYREIPHTNSPQPGDITYHPGHVQMVLNDGLILEAANPRVPLRIIDHNWMKPTAYFDPTKMSGATA
jgi:cell wall-associated NlpC family hydrolase